MCPTVTEKEFVEIHQKEDGIKVVCMNEKGNSKCSVLWKRVRDVVKYYPTVKCFQVPYNTNGCYVKGNKMTSPLDTTFWNGDNKDKTINDPSEKEIKKQLDSLIAGSVILGAKTDGKFGQRLRY